MKIKGAELDKVHSAPGIDVTDLSAVFIVW